MLGEGKKLDTDIKYSKVKGLFFEAVKRKEKKPEDVSVL